MPNSQKLSLFTKRAPLLSAQFPYKYEALVIIVSSRLGHKFLTSMPYPNALTASGSKYKI